MAAAAMLGSRSFAADENDRLPRIAVLFERGRHGAAALQQASELAAQSRSELTVVVLAPRPRPRAAAGLRRLHTTAPW